MVARLYGCLKFKNASYQIIKGDLKMAAKKAFGGYSINFKGRKETLEDVFGSKPIGPSEMTKKIWTFVKAKKLAGK